MAAAAIRKACRAKFPAVTQESVELPAEARKKIHGQAGMRANDTFGGTIYNGNADWTVTQVTIRLTPNGSDDQLLAADARDYNVDIAIQPLTSLDFSFNVGLSAHHNFAWKVSSSKGRFDPSKRQPVQTNQ